MTERRWLVRKSWIMKLCRGRRRRADLDVRHRGATLGDGQQVARPLALILDGRVVIEGTVAELRQLLLDSLQQLEIAEITALLDAVSH